MKQILLYPTPEDKAILENSFIFHKNSSRKNFLEWLDNLFKLHAIGKYVTSSQTVLSKDFQIDVIWNKESGKTLAAHVIQHPRFKLSNEQVSSLAKLQPDWSRTDKDGNTILHIAAKHQPEFIEKITTFRYVDKNILNHQGQCYQQVLLESFDTARFEIAYEPRNKKFQDLLNETIIILSAMKECINRDVVLPKEDFKVFVDQSYEFCVKHKEFLNQHIQLLDSRIYNFNMNLKEYANLFNEMKTQTFSLKLEHSLEPKNATRLKSKI